MPLEEGANQSNKNDQQQSQTSSGDRIYPIDPIKQQQDHSIISSKLPTITLSSNAAPVHDYNQKQQNNYLQPIQVMEGKRTENVDNQQDLSSLDLKNKCIIGSKSEQLFVLPISTSNGPPERPESSQNLDLQPQIQSQIEFLAQNLTQNQNQILNNSKSISSDEADFEKMNIDENQDEFRPNNQQQIQGEQKSGMNIQYQGAKLGEFSKSNKQIDIDENQGKFEGEDLQNYPQNSLDNKMIYTNHDNEKNDKKSDSFSDDPSRDFQEKSLTKIEDNGANTFIGSEDFDEETKEIVMRNMQIDNTNKLPEVKEEILCSNSQIGQQDQNTAKLSSHPNQDKVFLRSPQIDQTNLLLSPHNSETQVLSQNYIQFQNKQQFENNQLMNTDTQTFQTNLKVPRGGIFSIPKNMNQTTNNFVPNQMQLLGLQPIDQIETTQFEHRDPNLDKQIERLIRYKIESDEKSPVSLTLTNHNFGLPSPRTIQMNSLNAQDDMHKINQLSPQVKSKEKNDNYLVDQKPTNYQQRFFNSKARKQRTKKIRNANNSSRKSGELTSLTEDFREDFATEYFPNPNQKKGQMSDFLQRQHRFVEEKRKKIEIKSLQKYENEGRELIFHPNINNQRSASRGSLSVSRSINDFLKDQEKFQLKKANHIKHVREQLEQIEKFNIMKTSVKYIKSNKKMLFKPNKSARRVSSIQTRDKKHLKLKNQNDSPTRNIRINTVNSAAQSSDDDMCHGDSMDEHIDLVKPSKVNDNANFLPQMIMNQATKSGQQTNFKSTFTNLHSEFGRDLTYQPSFFQHHFVNPEYTTVDHIYQPDIQIQNPIDQVESQRLMSKEPRTSCLVIPNYCSEQSSNLFQNSVAPQQMQLQKELKMVPQVQKHQLMETSLKNQVINQIKERQISQFFIDYAPPKSEESQNSHLNYIASKTPQPEVIKHPYQNQNKQNENSGCRNIDQEQGKLNNIQLRSMSDLNKYRPQSSFGASSAINLMYQQNNCPPSKFNYNSNNQNINKKILQDSAVTDGNTQEDENGTFLSSQNEPSYEQLIPKMPPTKISETIKQQKLKKQNFISPRDIYISGSSGSPPKERYAAQGKPDLTSKNQKISRDPVVMPTLKRFSPPKSKDVDEKRYLEQTQSSVRRSQNQSSSRKENGKSKDPYGMTTQKANGISNLTIPFTSSRNSSARNSPRSTDCSQLNLSHQPKVNPHTDWVLFKKFIKEFDRAVLLVDHDLAQNEEYNAYSVHEQDIPQTIPQKLSCYTFVMLLAELGAIRPADIENQTTTEYKKVEEMWMALIKAAKHPLRLQIAADDDTIFVEDAKNIIMAIFGIKFPNISEENKTNNQNITNEKQPTIRDMQMQQFPDDVLPYGWLAPIQDKFRNKKLQIQDKKSNNTNQNNKQYELQFTQKCLKKIKRNFNLLNMNRINAQAKFIEQRKQENLDKIMSQMSFKPYLISSERGIFTTQTSCITNKNAHTNIIENGKLVQSHTRNKNGKNEDMYSVEREYKSVRKNNADGSPRSRSLSSARSLSKNYREFYERQNTWRDEQKKIKEQKEMEQCTFKPNIKKSANKQFQQQNNQTYFSTNLSAIAIANQFTNATDPSLEKTNSALVKNTSRQVPQSIQSKTQTESNLGLPNFSCDITSPELSQAPQQSDPANKCLNLSTLKRHEQLYEIGKMQSEARKMLSGRSSDQIEFEKQKNECTFRPKRIAKDPKRLLTRQPSMDRKIQVEQNTIEESQNYQHVTLQILDEVPVTNKEKQIAVQIDQKQSNKIDRVKRIVQQSQNMAIHRQKLANIERQYIEQCKLEGKTAKLVQKNANLTQRSSSSSKQNQYQPIAMQSKQIDQNNDPQNLQNQLLSDLQFDQLKNTSLLSIPRVSDPKNKDLPKDTKQIFEIYRQLSNQSKLSEQKSQDQKNSIVENDESISKNEIDPVSAHQQSNPPLIQNQNSVDSAIQQNNGIMEPKPQTVVPPSQLPVMFVDVFVEQDGQPMNHRIPVYEGDRASVLAAEFCMRHGFDEETQGTLQESLQLKINEILLSKQTYHSIVEIPDSDPDY